MKIHYSVAANPRHLVTAYFSMMTLRKAWPGGRISVLTNLRQEKFLAEALEYIDSELRISVIDTELDAKSLYPWPRYVGWLERNPELFHSHDEPILWASNYAGWLKSPELLLPVVGFTDIALPIDRQKIEMQNRRAVNVIPANHVGERLFAPECFVNRYGFIEDNWLCLYQPYPVTRGFFEFLDSTDWNEGLTKFYGWSERGWQHVLSPEMDELEAKAQAEGGYRIRGIPPDLAHHPMFAGPQDWNDLAEELAAALPEDPIVYCGHKGMAKITAERLFPGEYEEALSFADRFGLMEYVEHAGGIF